MPDVIEAPVPEVIAPTSDPRRFEIPSFTDKTAEAGPVVEAPKADSPPATEIKPPEVAPDPEAERAGKARADRQKINRLYKQVAEEKARREFFEGQVNAFRQSVAPQQGEPDFANFTDINEYKKALVEHTKARTVQEYDQYQQQRANQYQQHMFEQNWNAQVDKAAAKYDDFDTVVGELKPVSPWSQAIMQAQNGSDIAYYLGTHMREAQRIATLHPVDQIREIGKIEAKLLLTPPTPKSASKAPAPISPLSGSAHTETTLTDGMDFEKFRKLRNKQLGRT